MSMFNNCMVHKGFYNDLNPIQSLSDIGYEEFWEIPDEDFPYSSAETLLKGSCEFFAMTLYRIMRYSPYIIAEKKNENRFHAFCQMYKDEKWYYIDARGITSSFDEFMEVAKIFVKNEYIIRPIESKDVKRWEDSNVHNKEAYAFSEVIIKKYRDCYTFD